MKEVKEVKDNQKLLKVSQAEEIYQLSRGMMIKAAEQAGACKRFGKSIRINREKFDDYLAQ